MLRVLKNDYYRLLKSKLIYSIAVIICLLAFVLTMLIRQDIRLGISVFGDLTAFRGVDDIIRIGLRYERGLGLFAAIFISVFIGQEYLWKTWQHKWVAVKSRTSIYVSKATLSVFVSAAIFAVFQIVVLLCSNQINTLLTSEYIAMFVSGLFVYAALGSVICMLSMLIKNSTASTIVCLCYVMLSETISSVLKNAVNLFGTFGRIAESVINRTVYGMSAIISSAEFTPELTLSIAINALAIILISTVFGLVVFRKYEL